MSYDCVNGNCLLSSEYSTPGLYDTLTDCENAVNNGSVKPVLIFNPLWSANKHVKYPLLINKLGDGYQQTIFQGFNLIPEEWGITSPILNSSDADILLNQLRQLCATSFLWSPNNGLIPYQEFTCDDWQTIRLGANNYQITAKFTMSILGSGLLIPYTPQSTGDPYFSNVVLLIQPQNSDSSIIDYSPNSKTITAYGSPSITILPTGGSQKYIYLDGVSDYLSLNTSSDFNFGTGDFTAESYVYSPQLGNVAYPCFMVGNYYFFNFNPSGKMNISWGYGNPNIAGNTNLLPNTLYHLAWVRINGTIYYYINGVLDFSSTTAASASANLGNFQIGWISGAGYYKGYLSTRITKGIGRYTANFSPPSIFPTH